MRPFVWFGLSAVLWSGMLSAQTPGTPVAPTTATANPSDVKPPVVAGTPPVPAVAKGDDKTPSGPKIDSIYPSTSVPGSRVTILGSAFGDEKGKSTVTISGKVAQTNQWSDTLIIATVPSGLAIGEADVVLNVVDDKGQTAKVIASGKAKFAVAAPDFDPTHFEVLTGVGAVLAGTEATSYTTNNDALSSTNVGRKTPEILLGGGFIVPWHKYGRWIEHSYCGTPIPLGTAKVLGKDAAKEVPKTSAAPVAADASKPAAKEAPKDAPPPTDPVEAAKDLPPDCRPGGAYRDYRPWEAFLSIRFAPASDQTINGFVIGGGYRITKYLSLLVGYSVTPVQEPSPGFRVAAAKIVTDNPTISPYDRYNPAALLNNSPGAFDGFPLFVYNASGVTTTKLFPSSPTVTHHRSGIFFGVGVPLNLTSFFKPAKTQ